MESSSPFFVYHGKISIQHSVSTTKVCKEGFHTVLSGGRAMRPFGRAAVLAHPVSSCLPSSLSLTCPPSLLLFYHNNHKLCLVPHRAGISSLHIFPAACLVSHRVACLPFLLLFLPIPVPPSRHGCPLSHMPHPLLRLLLTLACKTPGCITNSSYSYRFASAPRSFPGTNSRLTTSYMCKNWRHTQMGPQL